MPEQPDIRLLPDQVINKIAAGEVVERPASVLKELFENALDAGADQVEVEVLRGGRDLIAVTDNGCGMSRDQALLSIERHATSKIRTEADIENIRTLGFRGEALAAISSVARFTLTTRPGSQPIGTCIQIVGGKLLECEEVGCPVGTRIEVRNLFFNVPARRKFLRAEQTELSHIRQLFLMHAIAQPTTDIRLESDARTLYQLPAAGTLADRMAALYKPALMSHLRPIDFEVAGYALSGFAGLPQTGRKDRQDQYLFINGRAAVAPVVYHALNEAYHPLIGHGRYPAVFLFIETDPALVDVNVHPAKKEVRFRHPNPLRDAIVAALNQALAVSLPSDPPEPETCRPLPAAAPAHEVAPQPRSPCLETQKQMDDLLVRPRMIQFHSSGRTPDFGRAPASQPFPEAVPTATGGKPPSGSPWGWYRLVGQLGGTYAVLETEDGYVLMEPRAAHERVLFERYLQAVRDHSVLKQGLLEPEMVELLPSDAQAVRQHLDTLVEFGFGVAEFGGDMFILDALPVLVQEQPVEALLIEIARALETGGKGRGAREMAYERIALAACQGVVRAKETLSRQEIEKLVDDLAKTEMPYTSPHGRPTLIFTSFSELDRKFSRT